MTTTHALVPGDRSWCMIVDKEVMAEDGRAGRRRCGLDGVNWWAEGQW